MAIKVRATQAGFYGYYRNPGEEFVVEDDKAFCAEWMERTTKRASEAAKPDSGSEETPLV